MDDFVRTTLTTPDLYDPALDALIAPLSRQVTYPARHIFLTPGDAVEDIYYVKQGRTKHFMGSAEGAVKILYILTPGWFFAETPAFLNQNTGLYSKTEVETVLYKIPVGDCLRLMGESSLFREKIIKCYSLKMLILRHEVENLTFNSCKNRLKRLFCSAVDTNSVGDPGWYNLKLAYTHWELGEIVGVSRVTVSRQINELCGEGFLRMVNRRAQVNIDKYHDYLNKTKVDDGNII